MSAVGMALAGASDSLGAVAQTLQASTVQVRSGRAGGGSGIVWRADGLIVTNAHVVHGRRLRVDLPNGDTHAAELVAADPRRDVAALRIDARDLNAAEIGDSDLVRPGQLAFAVGNPLGLVGAVTAGIIVSAGSGPSSRARWIQADVRIAPGNSGGPLADAGGRVVGINSMIYGGLAVAVPSNAVERFLRAGRSRPRLGVTLETVRMRVGVQTEVPALLVFEVAAGSAAERAGMLAGDAIIAVSGTPLRDESDLADALIDCAAGADLQLTVARGGSVRDISVAFTHSSAQAA
ncbi:MAG: trypsin-like peptidase domain-containing protein [Candidatus Eremiobacteraeota bacterium]|nr:trypsin-like peptidase domain-containing protein [Candidatus Eremiobacteraeota bacterium]